MKLTKEQYDKAITLREDKELSYSKIAIALQIPIHIARKWTQHIPNPRVHIKWKKEEFIDEDEYREQWNRQAEIKQETWQLHRKQKRDRALQALGNKCMMCGIDDKRILHIHHVYGNPNKEKSSTAALRILAGYTDEYQILCANCHRLLHCNERGI